MSEVLKDFEARLMAWEPQAAAKARMALEAIRHGLGELSALGHSFHIAEGSGPQAPSDFPMMLYHSRLGQTTVKDLAEFKTMLASGWDVHPSLRAATTPPAEPETT